MEQENLTIKEIVLKRGISLEDISNLIWSWMDVYKSFTKNYITTHLIDYNVGPGGMYNGNIERLSIIKKDYNDPNSKPIQVLDIRYIFTDLFDYEEKVANYDDPFLSVLRDQLESVFLPVEKVKQQ